MNNITIGIEGLVGSGKTSLCRELVKMIPNSIILHGGNIYRGIVYALLKSNIDFNNSIQEIDIKNIMDLLKVEVRLENNETKVYVDGIEISEENLQSETNSMAVSKIAKNANNSKFYIFANKLIEEYKSKYNVIISGRDLMRIYPNLDYHFFITADLEERINRKMKQYDKEEITKEELKRHIETRDKLQAESGFYKRYENTIDIDITDCKNEKESANKVFERLKL